MDIKKILITAACFIGLSQGAFAGTGDAIEWKGDLRFRHENVQPGPGAEITTPRARMRLQARLGAKAPVNEFITFYGGLATGGSNPRSTNQTLDTSFTTKDFGLDYAYASIKLRDTNLLVGKMKNPLMRVSDLMWDSDITPEGLAVKHEFNNGIGITGAWFQLEEQHDLAAQLTKDPKMIILQPTYSRKITERLSTKLGASYYSVSELAGVTLKKDEGSNSSQTFTGDWTIIGASGELTMKNPIANVNQVSVFVDYLTNSSETTNNKGYLAGIKIGDKNVTKKGQWQTKVMYRHLESNATLDVLPDSDAFGGATGVKGLELIFSYGLATNTVASLDYYNMETIDGSNKESLLQADIQFKF